MKMDRPAAYAPQPQKPFAIAFAVLALTLAGCASGLGATAEDTSSAGALARVEDGTLLASRPVALDAPAARRLAVAYTVKLRSGELATVEQVSDSPIANGTPVLVEYGDHTRVIPQNRTIGY
jgi:hypothetical protein